jgi:hypothetical protein
MANQKSVRENLKNVFVFFLLIVSYSILISNSHTRTRINILPHFKRQKLGFYQEIKNEERET